MFAPLVFISCLAAPLGSVVVVGFAPLSCIRFFVFVAVVVILGLIVGFFAPLVFTVARIGVIIIFFIYGVLLSAFFCLFIVGNLVAYFVCLVVPVVVLIVVVLIDAIYFFMGVVAGAVFIVTGAGAVFVVAVIVMFLCAPLILGVAEDKIIFCVVICI